MSLFKDVPDSSLMAAAAGMRAYYRHWQGLAGLCRAAHKLPPETVIEEPDHDADNVPLYSIEVAAYIYRLMANTFWRRSSTTVVCVAELLEFMVRAQDFHNLGRFKRVEFLVANFNQVGTVLRGLNYDQHPALSPVGARNFESATNNLLGITLVAPPCLPHSEKRWDWHFLRCTGWLSLSVVDYTLLVTEEANGFAVTVEYIKGSPVQDAALAFLARPM